MSKVIPTRNCDKEIRSLFDYHRYDSSAPERVELQVPSDKSIGLYAQNWVDSHKNWLLEDYQSHVRAILDKNFQPVDVSQNATEVAETIRSKAALRAKLEDPLYVRKVLEKLLEYESVKDRQIISSIQPEEFNRALARTQDEYKVCHRNIDDLNAQIEERLRAFENPTSEIDLSRKRMQVVRNKIEAIEVDIPKKTKEAQKDIARLDNLIAELEKDLSQRRELEAKMYC